MPSSDIIVRIEGDNTHKAYTEHLAYSKSLMNVSSFFFLAFIIIISWYKTGV